MNDFEHTLSILGKTTRNGDCLEGKVYNGQRYPYIQINRKHYKVSRLILRMWSQDDGGGLFALHTCDNTKCINPSHLYWGTQSQNNLDSSARKRHINAKKTHCKNGHLLVGDNIRMPTKGPNKGKRMCKICTKMWRLGTTPRTSKGQNE